jgi:hypothetical protein
MEKLIIKIHTLPIDIEHNVAIDVNNNKKEKLARNTEIIQDEHKLQLTSKQK